MKRSTLGLLLASLLLTGCEEHLATEYGSRFTSQGGMSVNGTTVLSNMFQQAGHPVYTRTVLTPALQQGADTIVWFPDSLSPPADEAIDWLSEWLKADPNHTLIYVGRDFDAAPGYWEAVIPGAPANKVAELTGLRDEARQRRTALHGRANNRDCRWFGLDYDDPHREIDTLSGPWADGIDPKKGAIQLDGRIVPDPASTVETLLSSGNDPLVWRWSPENGGGQVIVVANGSFLLNYPLLNHEHRKLAAKLVAAVQPGGRVVFLESDEGGPRVSDQESAYEIPGGLAMFTVWPLSVLLLHLAALGVVCCVCLWPIFGRPATPRREALSDFGKHIDALGEMLELTGDQSYATIRVLQYQQAQRGEAVPPSALRGPIAPPQSGQTPGAPPAMAEAGRRRSAPSRKQL